LRESRSRYILYFFVISMSDARRQFERTRKSLREQEREAIKRIGKKGEVAG